MRSLGHRDGDEGVAMIIVLMFGIAMLLLALVASRMATSQIRASNASSADQGDLAPLGAADAGLDEYLARLQDKPLYFLQEDANNPWLQGWTDVPGGAAAGEYWLSVDSSASGTGGELNVFTIGKVGGVMKLIRSVLHKRSTLDYVYLSDIETPSPRVPGAYATTKASGMTETGQQIAARLCSRQWYRSGDVSPAGVSPATGNQRNLDFCQWAGIYSSERIVGKLHSNDVWRLDNVDLSQTLDVDSITSSCPSTVEEGLTADGVPCPAAHRFIGINDPPFSNNGKLRNWVSTSPGTAFQGSAWRPPSAPDNTGRNPGFDSVLELPSSTFDLKHEASNSGCVYTGPTRIRFAVEGGQGYMYVTSPDTKQTSAACGGTSLRGDPATPHVQPTVRVPLAALPELAIYVQDVLRPGAADDSGNAYDLNNIWDNSVLSTTEPSCRTKSTGKAFPYVIPSDTTDKALFNSGSTYKGFPSELADPASPWYSGRCAKGDIYVQGTYQGQMTVSTQGDIVITSSLVSQGSSSTTAQPAASATSVVGLVSEKFTYIYRPFTNASTPAWVADWKTSNATNLNGAGIGINAAIMAVTECFAAQDPYSGSRNGDIYLWGSLAQKYRCVVGSNGGYNKRYSFDERLYRFQPPFMLDLSTEPWEVVRQSEVSVETHPLGQTRAYSLLDPTTFTGDSGATVRNVLVQAGTASVSLTGGGVVNVTPTTPGPLLLSYEVVQTSGQVDHRNLYLFIE